MTPEELGYFQWDFEQWELKEVKEALQQADSGRLVPHSTVKRLFIPRYAPDMVGDFGNADSLARLQWADVVVNHLRSSCELLNRSELSVGSYLSKVFSTVEMVCEHSGIGRHGRVRGTSEWDRGVGMPTVVYRERCGNIEVLGLPVSNHKWPHMKTASV